jgi:hypothetical protein
VRDERLERDIWQSTEMNMQEGIKVWKKENGQEERGDSQGKIWVGQVGRWGGQ